MLAIQRVVFVKSDIIILVSKVINNTWVKLLYFIFMPLNTISAENPELREILILPDPSLSLLHFICKLLRDIVNKTKVEI